MLSIRQQFHSIATTGGDADFLVRVFADGRIPALRMKSFFKCPNRHCGKSGAAVAILECRECRSIFCTYCGKPSGALGLVPVCPRPGCAGSPVTLGYADKYKY